MSVIDPERSVANVRFAATKRDAYAVHSPESGVTVRLDYLTRFHTTRHVSRGSVERRVRRSPLIS